MHLLACGKLHRVSSTYTQHATYTHKHINTQAITRFHSLIQITSVNAQNNVNVFVAYYDDNRFTAWQRVSIKNEGKLFLLNQIKESVLSGIFFSHACRCLQSVSMNHYLRLLEQSKHLCSGLMLRAICLPDSFISRIIFYFAYRWVKNKVLEQRLSHIGEVTHHP